MPRMRTDIQCFVLMWPVPKSLDQVVDPHGTAANDSDSVVAQQGVTQCWKTRPPGRILGLETVEVESARTEQQPGSVAAAYKYHCRVSHYAAGLQCTFPRQYSQDVATLSQPQPLPKLLLLWPQELDPIRRQDAPLRLSLLRRHQLPR